MLFIKKNYFQTFIMKCKHEVWQGIAINLLNFEIILFKMFIYNF